MPNKKKAKDADNKLGFIGGEKPVASANEKQAIMSEAAKKKDEAEVLVNKASKMNDYPDMVMLNPRGRIVTVKGKMVLECRRKGFTEVDPKTKKAKSFEEQPIIISEEEETKSKIVTEKPFSASVSDK